MKSRSTCGLTAHKHGLGNHFPDSRPPPPPNHSAAGGEPPPAPHQGWALVHPYLKKGDPPPPPKMGRCTPKWGHTEKRGVSMRGRGSGGGRRIPRFLGILRVTHGGAVLDPGTCGPSPPPLRSLRVGKGSAVSPQDRVCSQDGKRARKMPCFAIGAFPLNNEVTPR